MIACRLLILTAVLPEAQAIARALGLHGNHSRGIFSAGSGDAVQIALIGIRGQRLEPAVKSMEAQAVIMAGLAGALEPGLRIGDVVMEGPAAAMPILPGIHLGKLHTSNKIISTPWEKARIFAATGALAVDMETSTARAFAAARGVPFAGMRAISDTADDFLDPRCLTLVDEVGIPRMGRVAALVCRHPAVLPGLFRLKRATGLALSRLGAAVLGLVESGWPSPNAAATARPAAAKV